jgi:Zn-dependent peptidase ImmA (M78 family)/DNA-binding XRE family transcriptional regulator
MLSYETVPGVTDTTTWISRRIREIRERLGWTQARLAAELGVTQTAVSYWESGKRSPGVDELIELADATGEELSSLLPPSERQPIRAILRATAQQLEGTELDEALEHLMDQADKLPPPVRDIKATSSRPLRAAQELIEQADITSPPVPVRRLAERCGVGVLEERFGDALSGMVVVLDDHAVIGVNSNHHPVRQRFTIGHELGHYLLDHHDRFHIDLGPSEEHGHPPGYDWRSERAANEFAAELLMPTQLVHAAFQSHPSAPDLASDFEVSELAMGYRLVNLGLR